MNAPPTPVSETPVSAPVRRLVSAGAPTPPLLGTRRPTRALLKYYILQSIATGPGLVVMLPLRYFRYHTLRYTFDDEGVTVRWGILFRREISLTYARIQDIHLVSNIFERWFGLGRVQVQTASGQAGAEMTIEGLPDFEAVRDVLYRRMRGARGQAVPSEAWHGDAAIAGYAGTGTPAGAVAGTASPAALGTAAPVALGTASPAALDEAAAALRDAVEELRAIRALLERRP
jgi:Bacterial PH domain